MTSNTGPAPHRPLGLHGWSDRAILGVGLVAVAAGFGQFGLTATLGDVARHFGHVVNGSSITDQAGLSGTQLGLGLAVIRLASLGGLPLAGLADRVGRRRVVLVACGLGLAVTAASAASPGYWWFVVVFALGRPLLSAAYAVTQVAAAEQTGSAAARLGRGPGGRGLRRRGRGHGRPLRSGRRCARLPRDPRPGSRAGDRPSLRGPVGVRTRSISSGPRQRQSAGAGARRGGPRLPGPSGPGGRPGLLPRRHLRSGQHVRLPLRPERQTVPRICRGGHGPGSRDPGPRGIARRGADWPTGSDVARRPWGP